MRPLGGKPLIAWTIEAALEAGFPTYVSTDDAEISSISEAYGATIIHCPLTVAHKDDDPDILWVRHALSQVECEEFTILRSTSPFRDAETIIQVLNFWNKHRHEADSLRTVRPVTEHPGKMWALGNDDIRGGRMAPLLDNYRRQDGTPWHSSPTQTLPTFYVQTAGMEVAHRSTVTDYHSIAGRLVWGYIVSGAAAMDINTKEDWKEAEDARWPTILVTEDGAQRVL